MKEKLLKIGLLLSKGRNVTTTKQLINKLEPWLLQKGAVKLNEKNWLFATNKGSCCLSTDDLGFVKVE